MFGESSCTYIALNIIIYEYNILKVDTNNAHLEVQVHVHIIMLAWLSMQ